MACRKTTTATSTVPRSSNAPTTAASFSYRICPAVGAYPIDACALRPPSTTLVGTSFKKEAEEVCDVKSGVRNIMERCVRVRVSVQVRVYLCPCLYACVCVGVCMCVRAFMRDLCINAA